MSFLFINKTLRLDNLKTRKLWMRKFPCLLFVLKRSYICYHIICMTVLLMLQACSYIDKNILWPSLTKMTLDSINVIIIISKILEMFSYLPPITKNGLFLLDLLTLAFDCVPPIRHNLSYPGSSAFPWRNQLKVTTKFSF